MKRLKLFFACLLMAVLSIGQVWGALSSPSSCTFSSSASQTTLNDDNTDVTWTASTAPSGIDGNSPYRGLQWGGTVVNNEGGLTLSCSSYSGKTITKIEVVWSRNNNAGATVSATVGGAAFGSADEYTTTPKASNRTATFTGSATGNIQINATSTASGNSFYIKSITVTFSSGSTPTLSLTPNSWDFGNVATDGEASKAFSLSGSNLTAGDLTISVPSGYSVSPSSLSVSAGTLEATAFTVSKNTNVAGTYDGDFTIYGGGVAQANAVSASLSMTVVAPVDPDITFNNGTVEVGEDLDLSSLFTSNSEGAVTYSIIEGSSYASLSGSVLTGEVIGDVTIQASQAANAGYNAKSVTATINVVAALSKSSLIFTAACGGSGTANDGAAWAVTSDAATESAFDNTKGIHYGTGTSGTGDVQYITLSTSDIIGTIKKIVVNASTASGVTATIDVSVGGDAFGGDAQSLSSTATNYTFTGSASGEIVVTITKPSKAAKALYCKSIIVSYEAAPDDPAVTVNPTSVSLATPDAVDDGVIDVTYTNINETQITVTLSDDEDGNVPFSGSWLTANLNVDKDIAYTVTENSGAARSAYIRLTAKASNGISPDVVKKIQVTQVQGIPTYTTLDAIFNAATSTNETVKVSFNDWVVSAVTTDKAYVTDGTYGLIIYTASHGFEVGDILSGTKQTQLKKYNGNSQLSGLKASDFVKTTGGVITPRVVSDPNTLSGANAGSVVKISGELTKASSKYYIGTIQIYNGLSYDFGAPTTGKVYDCTGVFAMFNSTKEVMPRQDGDLVESVETPTAVITFNDFSIEKGQNTTLSATVSPAAAASATVTYSIVDGGEYVSLSDAVLTANEIGTAHIRATVADNLPNYNGATKDITVNVVAPDTRKQAKDEDGFDEISGTLNSDISYASYKGGGTANPNVKDNAIQLYQISGTNANGGYITFTAAQGCKIDQVKITTAKNATHIAYAADGGDLSVTTSNVPAGSIYLTDDNLDAQNVSIYCMHNNSDNRLFVATAVVYYTGTPVAVESIALSGTYPTVFGQGDAFSHEGMTVTATYTNSTSADVTGAAEFTGYDMDVLGPQTVTVSYGGQSTTYGIVVNAATVVDLALSGTYPTRFNVNDAFSHDGMTVTATYSNTSEVDVTADATFSGYNMTTGGIQTVTVEYGGESATYSIIVAPANTDVMVATDLAANTTDYVSFTNVTNLGTDAIYAGENAKSSESAIQLRTKNSREGIVVTDANGSKIVKSVSIAYQSAPTNDRKLLVYGKHTAYTSAANLYGDAAGTLIGEIAADGSLDCTATEEYEYIGLRSSDGAIYVAVIMIEWADPTPTTYAVTYASDHGSAPAATNAAAVTLEELTADGWTHNGWVANVDVEVNSATVTAGTLIDNGTEVVLSAATEFTAQWTENPPVGPDYTEVRNGLTEGWYYTMCLDKAVTAVKAGSIWRVLSKAANGTDVILEEVTGTLQAGRPYIFLAAANTLEVAYTGDAVGAPVTEDNNGLIGSFTEETIAQSPNNFIIYNNALYYVNSDNVKVGAHRAYLNMNGVPNYEPQQGNAPRRRVVMTVHGEQTATGCENINASETPVKMIIDGQMYILRGEKMYDATGKLVK